MDFTYRLNAEGGDAEAHTGNEHKARRNAFESTLIHYYSFLGDLFRSHRHHVYYSEFKYIMESL